MIVAGAFLADPPVKPIELAIDLPFPPSVNSIWRVSNKWPKKKVIKSMVYKKWLRQTDLTILINHQFQKISGPFEITIHLNDKHSGDGDNRIKAVLDYLQSREIIENDKFCRAGSWRWVPPAQAPEGCRVYLRSLP